MGIFACCSNKFLLQGFKVVLVAILLGPPSFAFALSTVNLTLDDGDAAEFGQDPGSFTVTRTDDGNAAQSLNVRVIVTGTAVRDADYSRPGLDFVSPNTWNVHLAANTLSRTITLTPVLDNEIEGEETIIIQLQDLDSTYIVGTDVDALMTLADDVAEVSMVLDDGEMAEFGQDPGSFTLTRNGHGNSGGAINVRVLVNGTAVRDADYSRPGLDWVSPNTWNVHLAANILSRTITLTPVLDNEIEGEETISVQLKDIGVAYTAPVENTVIMIIADFVEVMFKDGFEDSEP